MMMIGQHGDSGGRPLAPACSGRHSGLDLASSDKGKAAPKFGFAVHLRVWECVVFKKGIRRVGKVEVEDNS